MSQIKSLRILVVLSSPLSFLRKPKYYLLNLYVAHHNIKVTLSVLQMNEWKTRKGNFNWKFNKHVPSEMIENIPSWYL